MLDILARRIIPCATSCSVSSPHNSDAQLATPPPLTHVPSPVVHVLAPHFDQANELLPRLSRFLSKHTATDASIDRLGRGVKRGVLGCARFAGNPADPTTTTQLKNRPPQYYADVNDQSLASHRNPSAALLVTIYP